MIWHLFSELLVTEPFTIQQFWFSTSDRHKPIPSSLGVMSSGKEVTKKCCSCRKRDWKNKSHFYRQNEVPCLWKKLWRATGPGLMSEHEEKPGRKDRGEGQKKLTAKCLLSYTH
ncbi:hypothetical protein DV515_00004254 [Chloebia gouldiae]|uniref:Uncharacterized protein n=1 Tax=Chloebia gouldiae TaxID=44316 RepID=A0A3L8SSE5_CHLGU|nr:hypothetical protein DV515_00004254 [Chloebia gouldiae]